MVKIWELTQGGAGAGAAAAMTWWSLDAPATGHALGMLALAADVRRDRARRADRRPDPSRCASCSKTRRAPATWRWRSATEMAVTETLELQDGLHAAARPRPRRGRSSTACCRGASRAAEIERIDALDGSDVRRARRGAGRRERARHDARELSRARPLHAARAVHDRARFQHNQLARLRRRSFEVLARPVRVRAPSSTCAARATDRRAASSANCSAPTALRVPQVDPEAVEQALVAAPVAAHAHRQVEVDLQPSSRSSSRRAAVPIALIMRPRGADQDPLLGLALHPDQRPHARQALARAFDLLDDHLDRVGTSWKVRRITASRISSASSSSRGWSEDVLRLEHERPLGHQRARGARPAPRTPVAGARRDREDLRRRPRARPPARSTASVAARDSRSTLFTAIVTGALALGERLRDEAVAGPDSLLAVEHQQRRVGSPRAPAARAWPSAR